MLEDIEEVTSAIHVLASGLVVEVMSASTGIHEDSVRFAVGFAEVFDDFSLNTDSKLLFMESAGKGVDIDRGLESLFEVEG